MVCETCDGRGKVPDHSGNFPDRPGVIAGPFVELMECPSCNGGAITPGRWTQHDFRYCPLEIYGNLDLVENQVRGTQVCEVLTNSHDARLISVSPDFLAFCQWILNPDKPVGSDAEFVRLIEAKADKLVRQAVA